MLFRTTILALSCMLTACGSDVQRAPPQQAPQLHPVYADEATARDACRSPSGGSAIELIYRETDRETLVGFTCALGPLIRECRESGGKASLDESGSNWFCEHS